LVLPPVRRFERASGSHSGINFTPSVQREKARSQPFWTRGSMASSRPDVVERRHGSRLGGRDDRVPRMQDEPQTAEEAQHVIPTAVGKEHSDWRSGIYQGGEGGRAFVACSDRPEQLICVPSFPGTRMDPGSGAGMTGCRESGMHPRNPSPIPVVSVPSPLSSKRVRPPCPPSPPTSGRIC
jgi:hypothetical protein